MQAQKPVECAMVMVTVPDKRKAMSIADALVHERLAACVQILAPCKSTYVWEGKTQVSEEVPLLAKTAKDNVPKVIDRVNALHPFEVPEIIVLPIIAGSQAYLEWVHETIA